MGEGFNAGFETGRQHKQALRVKLAILLARFKDWRQGYKPVADEPHRAKGQHVSWLTYKEVKHSLKLVGMARGYEDVKAVAKMHNIGRSTAYEIKRAHSFADFKGKAKHIDIAVEPGKAHRIKVTAA